MESQMELFWLGHAGFKIKLFSGRIICLDPYQIKEDKEKADIIICSHTHGDHFSKSDIKKVWKDNTILIGPTSIKKDVEKFSGQTLKFGEQLKLKDLTIELVPAYTIIKNTHPKSNNWSGTILTSGNKSVYHAGDTERIPEMKELSKRGINVAILPCGGIYTMDFDEATDAALDIKPEIVVPMHNWDKDLQEFKRIMLKKDPKIRVEILEQKSLRI
jgi:L-ascorbate metabolism protein UlaG (beta-lactamase superfamily)